LKDSEHQGFPDARFKEVIGQRLNKFLSEQH
jgi:hypothetical protein